VDGLIKQISRARSTKKRQSDNATLASEKPLAELSLRVVEMGLKT